MMEGRVLPCLRGAFVLGFAIATLLWAAAAAHAQDAVTNLDQIAAAFDQPGLDCPLAMPYEVNWLQPIDTWFLDFTSLTNAIAAVTNYTAETQSGVSAWRLRLIQDSETGEVVLKPSGVDAELLRIDAPSSFVAFQSYNRVLRSYCLEILAENPSSYEDLIAEGYSMLDPPRLAMDVFVVSTADEDAYFANLFAAEGGSFMLMSEDEEGDDSDPCSITNLTQPFFIASVQQDTNHFTAITWPSCTMFRYLVQSADQLSTDTIWSTQSYTSYVWGRPNTTT